MTRDASRSPIPSPGRLGLLGDRAREHLDQLGWTDEAAVPLLWSLSRAPDPDLAVGVAQTPWRHPGERAAAVAAMWSADRAAAMLA